MTLAQKNFKLFKGYCKKHLVALALTDWLIDYKMEADPQDAAWVNYNTEHRHGTISMDELTANDPETTEGGIEMAALEEVLHLLFARLTDLAGERCVRKGEIEEEEHSMIKKLLHAMVVVPALEKTEKKRGKRS